MQLGCCLISWLLFIGPRTILLFSWAFSNWYNAFETWYFALLGWMFFPWVSMVYMYAYFHNGGQINGWYWFWIIFALVLDLTGSGSTSSTKKKK